jgi:DNA-directed RNA polymerase subunit RPC12/RpoP
MAESKCEHGWTRINYVKCPRCADAARHAEEIATLRASLAAALEERDENERRLLVAKERREAAEARAERAEAERDAGSKEYTLLREGSLVDEQLAAVLIKQRDACAAAARTSEAHAAALAEVLRAVAYRDNRCVYCASKVGAPHRTDPTDPPYICGLAAVLAPPESK